MNDEREAALEQMMHRELRQLPLRRAPATLLPKVLAAIRTEAAKPWWQRPLETWPRWMQIITVAMALGIAAVLATLVGLGVQSLDFAAVGATVGRVLDRFEFVWTATNALGNALVLILSRTPTYVFLASGLVCVSAYVSCVGLGTVLYRLAASKSRS